MSDNTGFNVVSIVCHTFRTLKRVYFKILVYKTAPVRVVSPFILSLSFCVIETWH